jgi:hypothetical protein
MGLDMYAYALRADLVGNQQVDCKYEDRIFDEMGFKTLTDIEYEMLNLESRKQYNARQNMAMQEAKTAGLVDFDFSYWRKFNHLHGWMEQLYFQKGGTQEFNCTTVRLMPEDLERLESLARMKAMAPAEGFFFGAYEPFDDEDRTEVLTFVNKAREAIKDGYAILYYSWW